MQRKKGGRYMNRRKTVFKGYTVLIAVIAIATLIFGTVAGTLAWLEAKSGTLTNTFDPGNVPPEVIEDPDTEPGVKNDVKIQNNGNIDAYIRVAVIPIWREADGKTGTGLPTKDTYNITWTTDSKWVEYKGYYYYTEPVAGNKGQTPILFTACSPISNLGTDYANKIFEMQVIASSIQATPPEAVADAWGVVITSGSVETVTTP